MKKAIEAESSTGIFVAFFPSDVIDWSWNAVAGNTENDPALEVVFDRQDSRGGLTQRLLFCGTEAERVAFNLLKHVCQGELK